MKKWNFEVKMKWKIDFSFVFTWSIFSIQTNMADESEVRFGYDFLFNFETLNWFCFEDFHVLFLGNI